VSVWRVAVSALAIALVLAPAASESALAAHMPSGASRGLAASAASSASAPVGGSAPPGGSASPAKSAPSGPPLTSPAGEGGAESTAGVPSAEGDQLVENGLSSPLCEGARSVALSSAAQSDCQTSGFVGAPAPTNNYELDVNIDTGALGLSSGGLLSVIQDVFIAPVWNALVWLVHALIVMLQWCYTVELLGGSTMSGLRSSLREAQASFTEPWLALVLAVASMLAFYNGLIRRRVAETLGQALVTIAMMAGGLWMIADPLGTVGAVGQFANEASLGTLGATAAGSTADAPRTLGDSMRALFAGTIELPWCYMEFGNVRWCSDPAALEPRLRKAALSLAAGGAKPSCGPSLAGSSCASSGQGSALSLARTSQLVRQATTNGALFLAFPANLPERNSVKESGSLLHILCQTEDDTKCEGSTAAQAEFRSDSGTFPRMIGVVLIAVGVLGMTMLFGLLAAHLLASAILSMFMLLLAPFAVLAPALGDAGRAFFTGWLTRMLGAVCSKLIFSFLLGALLTMQRMLASLEPLGWWTQWLLISAFWWVVFLKRRQAIAFVRSGGRAPVAPIHRQSLAHRFQGARQAKRDIAHPVRWAKDKLLSPLPANEDLRKRDRGRPEPGKSGGEQAGGWQSSRGQKAGRQTGGEQQDREQQAGKQKGEGQKAGGQRAGNGSQREDRLGQDGGRVGERPSSDQWTKRADPADAAQRAGKSAEQARHFGEHDVRAPDVQAQSAETGSQAADAGPVARHGRGSGRNQDSGAKPTKGERAARLAAYASAPELDEAALLASARQMQTPAQPQTSRSPGQQRQSSARQRQPQVTRRRLSEPAATDRPSPPATAPDAGAVKPGEARTWTSREIMDDAREVAARRKRQLGLGLSGAQEFDL
jgi:hypothetical protein